MSRNQLNIIPTIIVLVLLVGSSCSTKKKTWAHKTYHNTNARYNGYFNGSQSIKAGVKKLHNNHEDDYTTILPVFPEADLKNQKKIHTYMERAIQKGSIVIQNHSIKIKGVEHCRWIDDNYLMIGKAYFYKGDFQEAIKTFGFIKNEYSKKEVRFDASLWLVRSFVQNRDFALAESELRALLLSKKTPRRLEKELALVSADFYVQKKDFITAKKELLRAIEIIKSKKKTVRLHYILAQIYQSENNYLSAQKHYKAVLKSNPKYEMAFNAKMSLARSLEAGNSDLKSMKKTLLKMAKDQKNKEYLDQIYYTIAEMEVNNQDTLSAIENYRLSTLNSVQNDLQKALSFLALGKIDFKRGLYKSSSAYYDSTIFYMDPDFALYEQSKEKKEVLSELVFNLNTVELQDSMQMLAKLSDQEKNIIIQNIINAKIEKERIEEEEKRLKQQMMYESRANRGREQFGNKTSGGQWYFYNPATLSFGLSEFRKKWGKRKLEDDWRRKDKKTVVNFENDTTNTDTLPLETQNTKSPKYYLDQLPKTKEDFQRSDEKIKSALYKMGSIYREPLKKIKLSNNSFGEIFKRFAEDKEYASLALYNIYLNQKESRDPQHKKTKNLLLQKYPNTHYANIIQDPNYTQNALSKKRQIEKAYQQVFDQYKNKAYTEVIRQTGVIANNEYKNKLRLLRGFSFIQINEIEKGVGELKKIEKTDLKAFEEAQNVLESIKDPSKMQKSNELAARGSPYLYRSGHEQMILLVLPKKGVDITYFKTLISDFHLNSIGNEFFEISALLFGEDKHMIIIKKFKNTKEAMAYYQLFLEDKEIMRVLNKSKYNLMPISFENFQVFYKNKDTDGYNEFFTKNYIKTD